MAVGPASPIVRSARAVAVALGGLGLAAFLVGAAVDLVHGHTGHAGWLLVGPLPFVAAGVLLAVRRPGWR